MEGYPNLQHSGTATTSAEALAAADADKIDDLCGERDRFIAERREACGGRKIRQRDACVKTRLPVFRSLRTWC